MNNILNFVTVNFINFYEELNNIGRLVFYIAIMLFVILIILMFIMILQKSLVQKQIKIIQDEQRKVIQKNKQKEEEIETLDIDLENDKTKDLNTIVQKLEKASVDKKDVTDLYEDEQEKTAIISYQELIKAAKVEDANRPMVKKIEVTNTDENEMEKQQSQPKVKPQEIFSSVFTPNQQPIYKENKNELKLSYNDSETFLKSLKEFRNNL